MAIADPELRGRNNRNLRNLLIYPRFQLPLIGINVGLTALSLLVVWVSGNEAFSSLEPMAAISGLDVDLYRKILGHHFWRFNYQFLFISVATLTVSAGATLYLSHKIAGPMVTLRRYLLDVKDGVEPIPHLHFRDRDFLMDLPPLVNDAVAALVARQQKKMPKRKSA